MRELYHRYASMTANLQAYSANDTCGTFR